MIIGEAPGVVVGVEEGDAVEDAEEGGVVVAAEVPFGIPFAGGGMSNMATRREIDTRHLWIGGRIDRLPVGTVVML
jgi:hypothetical protein